MEIKFKLKQDKRSTHCETMKHQKAMWSDRTYKFSTAKLYLLEKPPRMHLNTTKTENILLHRVVLELITLSVKTYILFLHVSILKSCDSSPPFPCPPYGTPLALPTAQNSMRAPAAVGPCPSNSAAGPCSSFRQPCPA